MQKPIVKLKGNETFQHPSGKLEKQITRKQLEKNPNMVRTHAHLYENAEEMKRSDSLSGKIVNRKSDVVSAVQTANGIIFSAKKKVSANDQRNELTKLAESLNAKKLAESAKKKVTSQPQQPKVKTTEELQAEEQAKLQELAAKKQAEEKAKAEKADKAAKKEAAKAEKAKSENVVE